VFDMKRQGARVQVDARFRGGGASANLAGRVVDLSATGLFLQTRRIVPIGEQLHLEFELPTGPVTAVGEVRWIAEGNAEGGHGLGIRFLRLSAASARAIDLAVGDATASNVPSLRTGRRR
jgi:uncharacterized protein (TIGR02266 family)